MEARESYLGHGGIHLHDGQFLKEMYIYLVEVMNVDMPKLPNAAEIVFDFASRHPVLFLVLNFGIAFGIGYLFLVLEDIKDWLREQRRARLRRGAFANTGAKAKEALAELMAEREAAKAEGKARSEAGRSEGGRSDGGRSRDGAARSKEARRSVEAMSVHSDGRSEGKSFYSEVSSTVDLELGRPPLQPAADPKMSLVELTKQLRPCGRGRGDGNQNTCNVSEEDQLASSTRGAC